MTKRKTKPILIEGRHPLVALLELHHAPELAKEARLAVNTLYVYRLRARKKKTLLLPAEMVAKLCKATGWAPHSFRPDLWPEPGWKFPGA